MKKTTPTLTLTLTLLHEDLMVEILLRLPVRSLLRFKSVCKSWRYLISDPRFAKSHFDLAAAPTHRLLLPTESDIQSLDIDASLQDDSALVRLDLKVPLGPSWGSCRGFIVFPLYGHINIWNPSTGTRRQIPFSQLPNSKLSGFGRGFGYDESRDDYLIVLLELDRRNNPVGNYCLPRVEVFSLKTNTSHFICGASDVGYECITDELFRTGLFLNHSLHWLLESKANKLPLIIAFDLIDRSLSEIPLPRHQMGERTLYLNIMGGCLSFCTLGENRRSNMCTIWVMKEYKVHSSWTKFFVPPLDDFPYQFFPPICFTKGEDLLGSSFCGRLVRSSGKGEVIECRECRVCKGIFGMLMHYNIYRESLLSLPGDFAKVEEEATQNEKSIEDHVAREDKETTEAD